MVGLGGANKCIGGRRTVKVQMQRICNKPGDENSLLGRFFKEISIISLQDIASIILVQ